jgi:hypothetical protein
LGFREAKFGLIAALEGGDYVHEAREAQNEKNLLAVGEVTRAFVIGLLRRTKSDDYGSSPHHADASVEVHVFRPMAGAVRWYVKAYFAPDASAVFISVHRS